MLCSIGTDPFSWVLLQPEPFLEFVLLLESTRLLDLVLDASSRRLDLLALLSLSLGTLYVLRMGCGL